MTSDRLIAGRYRLTDPIGTGAMGVVWRATDVRLRRTVAVKQVLLAPGLTGTQALEAKLRAMREGRIAARLHHPNAITVFDVAEEDGQPWLVMEYMNAPSLAVKISGGTTLSPLEVAGIGAQAAAALSAAHDAGIMHRDVKPANLLVGDDGTVKLTDFGISHATGDVTVTATGFLAGTPAYLAPEIARGDNPKPAADVFALGSTLYAAVEGAPPFGEGDNPLAVLHAVARGVVPEPTKAGPLGPVLMWLLTADDTERPTMAQARRALEDVAAGRVPALPATATKVLDLGGTTSTPEPPTQGGRVKAAGLLGSGLAFAKAARSAITGGSSGAAEPDLTGPPRPAEPRLPDTATTTGGSDAAPTEFLGGVRDADAPGRLSSRPPAAPLVPARTDSSTNRAVLLLAAAVAAFTVMLVVLVVTRDRGGDPGQQAQDPPSPVTVTTMVDGKVSTVVIVPEQETITVSAPPLSGATTAPTSAPATSSATSTPRPTTTTISTTPFGPPTPERINQFIASYYGMLPGNTSGAWSRLAPGYQAQTGGFGQYSSFWSTVRSVTVGSITPSGPDRAVVSLTYHLTNGSVSSENRWITVTGDAGNLQIAGSGV
ncbi:serine/threonine-protein kinase [Nocardia caishijiensis]|uniref:non-specific serine/threonine protein kinase n=1 Tax=Nocardia caishijiensis TaxID=184756 RepID=A0ABQ6YN21_9NOCA|nr:serine/threonine-protein kinase [Nocardia caishijiensis]KAF0847202.1 serine/threonine protein kinase [Nocardia caishijiensis]